MHTFFDNPFHQEAENFRDRIKESGGRVIGAYQGINIPVECLCSKGHTCYHHPGSIRNSNIMCRTCASNNEFINPVIPDEINTSSIAVQTSSVTNVELWISNHCELGKQFSITSEQAWNAFDRW